MTLWDPRCLVYGKPLNKQHWVICMQEPRQGREAEGWMGSLTPGCWVPYIKDLQVLCDTDQHPGVLQMPWGSAAGTRGTDNQIKP